jgi:predicted DCC family thiol-disulfide oxidoreductase YuxK
MNVTYPLTIFFDASCPVCAHEVALLQRYDVNKSLAFIDCSPAQYAPPAGAPEGVTRAAMMARIHGQDASGQWLVAEKVFAAAYEVCGFGLLARMWGHPRLERFWQAVYPWIADNRMLLSKLGMGAALAAFMKLLAPFATKNAAKKAAENAQICAAGRVADDTTCGVDLAPPRA